MRWPLRRVLVRGPSMVPTLRDGDQLLVWFHPRRAPDVGQVVVVALPDRPLSVKRLAAVEAGGTIAVVGDNPFASTDSRELGLLSTAAIRGVVLVRIWPSPGRIRRSGPGNAG